MDKIIIVGFGGHGKSVADMIKRSGKYEIVGYTDINDYKCSLPYLGTDEVLEEYYNQGVTNVVIGIGYLGKGNIRETLYNKIKSIGFNLPVIIDPSAVISDDVLIGEGTVIGKCAVINCYAKIGKMCIINTNATIEHECVVDDYSHISVGTVLCGQVKVNTGAFIGANAVVIQCREIDKYQIVPAGVTIR